MKITHKKILKPIVIVIGSILLVVAVVIAFISPITKYLIEKYDEKYTGRQIELGWIYVNPFTGYIHIKNLQIFESKDYPAFKEGDSIFFRANGVSVNFAMLKLLSQTIEITDLALDHPNGIIIQNKKEFNYFDLIKKFTPEKPSRTPSKVHFSILHIQIDKGEFHFREKQIPINYFIREVNLVSTGKRWDSDTIAAKISLLPGIGSGKLSGNFSINFKTNKYRCAVLIQKFDLNIIQQYIKDLTNHGIFSANLDADIKARGSFTDEEDLNASGMLAINDFHFGKQKGDDFASFDKLVVAISAISPKDHQYLFDSVSLEHPFFKYERYDSLDNVQNMFGVKGANIAAAASDPARFNLVIEIAKYVKVLAKNFFRSDYQINRLGIYHGDFQFNDFALSEKFSVALHPFYFIADSIDKNRTWVTANLNSGISPFGNSRITLRINPKDSADFDIRYVIQKVPVSMFNPYLLTYTSFPLDRGTIEIRGTWNVREGMIRSTNHLLLIDPRRSGRKKSGDNHWLPLPLFMALIRERGNVVDYEIPITGNLKDPKFHLHDVLIDVIENIFVKPATTLYRKEVRTLETEIEKSLTLKWEMRSDALLHDQQKFIGKMTEFLEDNKQASISVYPQQYADKEKEQILYFEARKKYYLLINHKNVRDFSEGDSEKVCKMSVRDPSFLHYLNGLAHGSDLNTVQEKCLNFIGAAVTEVKFRELNQGRKDAFILPFKEKHLESRVIIHAGENVIPYNGFSFYKLTYKGELPANVLSAHRKMNELNNEAPRKKYKKERRRIKL